VSVTRATAAKRIPVIRVTTCKIMGTAVMRLIDWTSEAAELMIKNLDARCGGSVFAKPCDW
jgi:hypothetical protein